MSSIRICGAGCGGGATVIRVGEVSTAGKSTTGCVFVISPLGVWIVIAASAARRGEGESERGGGEALALADESGPFRAPRVVIMMSDAQPKAKP